MHYLAPFEICTMPTMGTYTTGTYTKGDQGRGKEGTTKKPPCPCMFCNFRTTRGKIEHLILF